MFNPLLREDFFPVICPHPDCGKNHSKEDFLEAIAQKGLIFVDCSETIYQGVHCINCGRTLLLSVPRENPLVDMREFYILPSDDNFQNIREQLFEINNRGNTSSPLHFEFICLAWDTDKLSLKQIEAYCSIPPNYESLIPSYIPYIMNSADIPERLSEEIRTKKVCFRRFYPKNNPYFTFLLYCCVPSIYQPYSNADQKDTKDRRTYFYAKVCESDDEFVPEIINDDWLEHSRIKPVRFHSEKYNSFYMPSLLALVSFDKLIKKIREKLTEQNVLVSDDDIISSLDQTILSSFYYNFHETIKKLSFQVDFVNQAIRYADKVYWKLYYDICSFHYLSSKRQELSEWVQKAEPGKALFVDAPMGLGKTYSIVETLVENPELSAVIFMPTRKLCEEIVERMKRMLAYKKGINNYTVFHNEEDARDIDGNVIFNEYGIPERRLKHYFLYKEVYYVDGINKYECPHYDQFVERYENRWIIKGDICEECENEVSCRFRKHSWKVHYSRVIVTTHSQYDFFSKTLAMRKWYKKRQRPIQRGSVTVKNKSVDRDFVIVDEDIVLSQCYQPIELTRKKFRSFVSSITNYFEEQRVKGDVTNDIYEKIDKVWAQFDKADTTVLIPPIDPEFTISEAVKARWEISAIPEEQWFIPEYLDTETMVPNLLDVIENTIRHGYVIQEYDGNQELQGYVIQKRIKKAYLPNPKFYDLEELPPHVFFDGTMLNERFLKHKLRNVKFEKIQIEFPSIWNNRVRQNINSDLPQSKIYIERQSAINFIDDIMRTEGFDKNFFVVSSKTVRDAYLENTIEHYKKYVPDLQVVPTHYGNLRGINEAKECDIGIMLGSHIPSDAVEIVMALELFDEEMKPDKILTTYGNLWTWKESKGVRVYKDKYKIIEEMANAIQCTEHRQAIARTRYLFHDVDFYILSKKPVQDYEPYFPKAETLQYRDDLFPPRKPRDDKYDEIKKIVYEWLSRNETVFAMNIYRHYGIRRQTVSKYLKKMEAEGFLVNVKNKKTIYRLPENKNGQDIL